MSSPVNLMSAESRQQLREELAAEMAALEAGSWPRDIDDLFRWNESLRCAPNHLLPPAEVLRRKAAHAARMVNAEMTYLDDLEVRIAEGGSGVSGWEAAIPA